MGSPSSHAVAVLAHDLLASAFTRQSDFAYARMHTVVTTHTCILSILAVLEVARSEYWKHEVGEGAARLKSTEDLEGFEFAVVPDGSVSSFSGKSLLRRRFNRVPKSKRRTISAMHLGPSVNESGIEIKAIVRAQNVSIPPPPSLLSISANRRLMALGELQRLHSASGECLQFLHIPKTAGTSIEETSLALKAGHDTLQGNITGWGRLDSNLRCRHMTSTKIGPMCAIHDRHGNRIAGGFIWHTPPSWDNLLQESYNQCTTFCVVRDPLAKLVSEWTYFGGCKKGHRNSVKWTDDFNEWAAKGLNLTRRDPFYGAFHWTPQAEFVYGRAVTAHGEHSARMEYCNRVLQFENLADHFHQLMMDFQLPVELHTQMGKSDHCHVSVSDATKKLIKEVYWMDYKEFGY